MIKLGVFVILLEKAWSIDYRHYINKVNCLVYDILEFQAQLLIKNSTEKKLGAEAKKFSEFTRKKLKQYGM